VGVVVGALLAATAACSGGDEPAQAEATGGTESGPNIVQPGAPGEGSETLSPDEVDEIDPPEATPADVAFMQAMIHHHAQALRMARYVPDRAEGRDLPLFAKRIELSQEDEINLMARWLEARDEQAFDVHDAGDLMPGMLTEAELDALKAARGRSFNRLFLEGMLRHHRGALQMVDELYETPGAGLEPALDAFARHVVGDQQIEIGRMETLLQELAQES
jgi:uncharacterized protein (DUF305 family)